MDFKELLNVADYNKAEAKSEASVKRYSSVLPPPKKLPKSNVQSDNIKRFLEKKKAEEAAKAAEARKQKEHLLALRAQNSKNNKKAKIMASRTKDNDFSRIKLTEDEILAKKKVEEELVRKNLADKVERMKARIEMEEREKLLPKKRKRKSKNAENADDLNHESDDHFFDEPKTSNIKQSEQNCSDKKNGAFKKPRPPPPAMSFSELLKVAEKKQFEPVEIPFKKKEEERLMTKKERKLMEQELERIRRKQEKNADSSSFNKAVSDSHIVNKKNIPGKITEIKITKKPVVIHVEKESKLVQESSKFKIPQNNNSLDKKYQKLRSLPEKTLNIRVKSETSKPNSNFSVKDPKLGTINDTKNVLKVSIKEENKSLRTTEEKKRFLPQKKSDVKIAATKQNVPLPSIDEDAIAAIERRIREKIEKEMEAKLAAKFGLNLQNSDSSAENKVANVKNTEKVKSQTELSKTPTSTVIQKVVKPSTVSQPLVPKKDLGCAKKNVLSQKPVSTKPPIEKKIFHKNPYLDPPRRLLEPQRPSRPVPKRRIESDEEEEDDMSDFIDDGPSQNDEDYSKYIKEIFGYDRSKYADCDDDDILESSFSEQMKEEIRSARLGYLEDLEEERLEIARKKKKKLKK